jgi:hypothetical protein
VNDWFQSGLHAVAGVLAILMTAGAAAACRPAALTELIEARRLASDLRVQFTKAEDAANRAVMADTDDASAEAAREAEQATAAVAQDVEHLRPLLKSLGYETELAKLDAFNARFAEYRKLDAEILPLAVENTNLKAQRLSFGPAREAAETFRASLEAVQKSATGANRYQVEALAARARIGVLEIQAIQAPHIAESTDDAMARMEEQMAASEAAARKALDGLNGLVGAAPLAKAAAALDRFMAVNREIVALSRRNTNVRSLALSLGGKRKVTAQCDEHLAALEEALARHEFTATR